MSRGVHTWHAKWNAAQGRTDDQDHQTDDPLFV
jgi:hypothetical protein